MNCNFGSFNVTLYAAKLTCENQQKQWVADRHNKFVKPRVTADGIGAELFDGSFVSVVDCPQLVPELLVIVILE